MKKSTIILAAALFCSTLANAAGNADNRSLDQTRKLSQTIQLNESNFIKVKQLNDAKFQEMDKATSQYANDAALKQVKLAEIENRFNTQVEALLNPTQKVAFQNFLNQNNSNIAIAK